MNTESGHKLEPNQATQVKDGSSVNSSSGSSTYKHRLLIIIMLFIVPATIAGVFWARENSQFLADLNPLSSQAANTIIVNAGGDLQAAINQAQLGDEIVVQAGATFTGNFLLPYKNTGTGYVTIRSSNLAQLPPEGQRVSPADAVNMPKIQTPNNAPVFYTESGATPSHHYKLIGLEITRPANSSQVTALVELGSNYEDQDTLAKVPHNFIFDRNYVHGHTNSPTRRGFKIESRDTEIRNSYISAFHESGYDSQAILSVNGPGNHIIFNNYLEAASENIMYGGDDPIIPGLVPTNILIEHNHFFKPLSWRGRNLAVKNLFELKNSKDVIVQYNIFENNWYDAQAGYGIVITPRSAGNAPWSTVDNTIIRYNIIKNTGNGISLFGSDYASNIQAMDRFTLEHNLFLVAGPTMDGNGIGMCISGRQNFPGQDVNITHNTFIANGRTFECAEGRVFTNFNFNDNIIASAGSDQGLIGQLTNGGAYGNAFMNLAFGNTWQYRNNVSQLDAYWRANHPNTSTYVDNNSAFGFQNVSGGIYKLASNSPFKNTATDGTDPGVNWDELMARTANVVSGASTGGGTTPPPSDTTPPSMSAGSPSGAQAAGTTQVNLTLSTNEAATCKYGTATGQTYANKPNTFSTTGSTSHSTQVTGLTNGQSYNYYVRCQDSAGNANTSDLTISFSVSNPPADTTPPVMGNGTPSGALAAGTTSTNITLTTNEAATCKYGTATGQTYANKPNTFSTTGSTSHSTQITGLTNGSSYTYRVRCQDTAGNANTSDLLISFSVSTPADTTPPTMSNGTPTGTLTAGTASTNLTLSTNEAATCKYGTATNQSYAAKPNTFTTTGGTNHNTPISGLTNGQSYNYYVRCQDSAGNPATTDLTISFSVAQPAGDTTAPTVSLTAPAASATVSGTTVVVSATASDNVGVVGVQFKLNGTNLGAEDTSSPYSINWNSTTASNGQHSLTAVARDAAGNITTSAARTVTVNNVVAPSTVATPTISPNGGSFSSAQTVTLASTTPDALIYYTTNGSDPTTASTLYSTPFQVTISSTVKAIAIKSGMTNSSVSSATFTITIPTPPTSGGGGGGGGGGGSSNPRPPSTPTTPSTPSTPSSVILPPNAIAGQTIKFPNNPTVYLVMSTGLHPFDTFSSLQAYQAQSGAVIITRIGTASTYTVSSTMAKDILAQQTGGNNEPTPAQPSANTPTNNTDFTCEGNPTIYYYSAGQKRAYTELAVFQAWNGNDFSKVTKHSASVCTSITNGPIVRLPDGTIIRVPGGPEIYMIAGNTARPFSSFSAYQRDSAGKTTYTVSIPYLHTYSRGADIN